MSKLTNMHSHKQQAEDKFLNSLFIFHATDFVTYCEYQQAEHHEHILRLEVCAYTSVSVVRGIIYINSVKSTYIQWLII